MVLVLIVILTLAQTLTLTLAFSPTPTGNCYKIHKLCSAVDKRCKFIKCTQQKHFQSLQFGLYYEEENGTINYKKKRTIQGNWKLLVVRISQAMFCM